MALSNIFGWNKEDDKQKSAACGTACGAAAPEENKRRCDGVQTCDRQQGGKYI